MATSAELVESSRCFDQCIPDGAKLGVLIYLAMTQAGLSMTATELLEASKCYDQCVPDGAKAAALMYLYENGGSGGTGTQRVFYGSYGDPNGDQTATGPALYYDDDGGVWGHYSVGTNNTNWSAIVA